MIPLHYLNPSISKIDRLQKNSSRLFVCISPHCEDGVAEMAIYSDWIVGICYMWLERIISSIHSWIAFPPRGYEPGSLKHIKNVLRWKSVGDIKQNGLECSSASWYILVICESENSRDNKVTYRWFNVRAWTVCCFNLIQFNVFQG